MKLLPNGGKFLFADYKTGIVTINEKLFDVQQYFSDQLVTHSIESSVLYYLIKKSGWLTNTI